MLLGPVCKDGNLEGFDGYCGTPHSGPEQQPVQDNPAYNGSVPTHNPNLAASDPAWTPAADPIPFNDAPAKEYQLEENTLFQNYGEYNQLVETANSTANSGDPCSNGKPCGAR